MTTATLTALAVTLAGCGAGSGGDVAAPAASASTSDADGSATTADAGEPDAAAVVAGYAEGVHASYAASLASAQQMDRAIDGFLAEPTPASLDAARDAWLVARDDYGPTEAFRFYGGPIDAEDGGVEGLVNAWPLDEAYVDAVEGQPDAGIVNDVEGTPEITEEVLVAANEQGGEANVSTGWHAIEFLLWGQDTSADGPGDRPAEDYTTAQNADRRGAYLAAASDLLLEHLSGLVDAWAPDEENYRAELLAMPPEEALSLVVTGIGELSRGELAGERMTVAFLERSQEDEHSCFSDNTTADIVANATGIQRVLTGDYPGTEVPGLLALVRGADPALAEQLAEQVATSVDLASAIPAPFDQHLLPDLPDDDPGRVAIEATITALEDQTTTIVRAADAVGVQVAVS